MSKKILITYASYGSGHKTSAQYVYDYFIKNGNYEVKIIDLLDYSSFIGKLSLKSFNLNFKIQKSLINNILYEIINNKLISRLHKKITNACLNKKLNHKILEFNPDILISTHFFGGIIMSEVKRKYHLNTKIITITTDYNTFYIFMQNYKNQDYYIVSNKTVEKQLLDFKIPKEKICTYGIPLSNTFKNYDKDIKKIKSKYSINNDNPIVLFFGGGSLGSTFTYKYLKAILKLNLKINIIFVSGNNTKLYDKCHEYIKENNIKNIIILGFTKDVNNLLNISNIVITKPGGLSVTEALELKTPMLLIPGNGGPEFYNAKFIVENKFGIKTNSPKTLAKNLKKLIKNPQLIQDMYNNLKNYEENKSVEKLFNLVKKELNKR